jgi:hypothetical protein
MYDVYLNSKNDLLVVEQGSPRPLVMRGNWKKKRAVRTVSNEIRAAIRAEGYYLRKLRRLQFSRNN